jgi:type I restriction enzyme, S subunit
MTEIPKGYKHTEVGVIPEEWEVKPLSQLSHFQNGKAHEQFIDEYGDYIVVNSKFISTGGEVKKYSKQNISPLQKGDITIVMSDIPNGKALAKCFQIDSDNKYTLNQRIGGITANDTVDGKYLYLKLDRNKYYLAFDSGTGQTNIRRQEILDCPIPLPPLPEQRAIAAALSDMDALIEAQEKLIAKKKAIKQGAMQELLRPKEGWEVKRLGEVANVTMGQSPLSKYYNSEGIGLPLVQGNADVKDRKTIVRFYTSEITKKGKHGDIIMSVRAPVGEVSKASFDCCLGRGVCSITFKNEYLYHFLINFEKSWSRFSTGSTFDSVNSKQVNELEILIPKEVYEQTRIARILSDMDSEIAQMEAQLDKYRNLKQGMMQELLTGKKRLIHDFGESDIPQENN